LLEPASAMVLAAIILKPADHVKRAGGWRADIGGCAGGQWGGGHGFLIKPKTTQVTSTDRDTTR
ncbi:MAG: hypothetical protein IMF18_04135, partial [Proteobacteria bacterium]|nr:hypothetical protein [Pseudomonadota bacterium]